MKMNELFDAVVKGVLFDRARIIVLSALKVAEMNGQDVKALRRDVMTEGGEDGEGYSLVYAAYVAILECMDNIPDGVFVPECMSPQHIANTIMNYPFTVRTLDKRIVIRADDSAKFVNKATTATKEAYSAVWKEFRAGCLRDNGKYNYITDLCIDYDDGVAEALYRRLPHGMDEMTECEYWCMEDAIKALHLTTAQERILSLRLRGYGYKAIASYIGITPEGVRKHCKLIAKKAEGAGMEATPAKRPESLPLEKAVTAYAFNKHR